jgi:histidinol-phosphate aminotransferase
MVTSRQLVHRSRRLVALSMRMGRRIVSELRNPSPTERLMSALPEIPTAPAAMDGKVVIVTGATQGVGLVVARRFAALGAKVVINGRRAEAVEAAVARLSSEGLSVKGVTVDVSTAEGVRHLLVETVRAWGGFDILINNAAIGGPMQPAWTIDAAAFEEVVKINLTGPILATLEAVRWLIENRKQGRVINVSTIATEGDFPNMVPYSTTKAGLESFTRFIAADLPQAEVVVTALILPSVRTERKAAADWASAELLPPTETVLPGFEHAATGPASLLHGRTFSAGRLGLDAVAESQLASVAALRQRIEYPGLVIRGEKVSRDPQKLVLLDRAENQHGTSPRALAAIAESLTLHGPNYYPDERFERLRQALAETHGLGSDCFAVGPGSWELISRAVQLFAKPGEQIVSSGPGWFGFNLTCKRHGVAQQLVSFDRGTTGNRPSHNLGAIRDAITPRTRLVYLISPSNPEGVTIQHAEMQEFLSDLPTDLPVIIDEAYAEFADDPGMVDVAALVREGTHSVIGLRTFSKFYGMAGLRVGYAYARPSLIDLISRSEQIFTLAHLAEEAALAALADREHRERTYRAALDARVEMQRALTETGIEHIPSQAPYIFAVAPKDFDGLVQTLADEGIVIPPYRFDDGRMVMLPVGRQDQNARILDAIRRRR